MSFEGWFALNQKSPVPDEADCLQLTCLPQKKLRTEHEKTFPAGRRRINDPCRLRSSGR
ncbi:hypothetical protein GCM10007082_30860 [Oceanisphaera arctica]|nr:hypothetical protein GCM10007082_30860 [Oceanisphaera arctica]